MKRIVCAILLLSLCSVGLVGCSKDETTIKKETEIKTPAGNTTITTEREVKKSGDNSPAGRP